MTNSILLQNGLLATYTSKLGPKDVPTSSRVDILIENDLITKIGPPLSIKVDGQCKIIDCQNKWVSPGFVDTHR